MTQSALSAGGVNDAAYSCTMNGDLAQGLGAARLCFACANGILPLSQALARINLT
jgi:hypothetical protein